MSLMNDALRKKNREDSGVEPAAKVSGPSALPGKNPRRVILLAALLMVTAAILGSMALKQRQGHDSLLAKPAAGALQNTTNEALSTGLSQDADVPKPAATTDSTPSPPLGPLAAAAAYRPSTPAPAQSARVLAENPPDAGPELSSSPVAMNHPLEGEDPKPENQAPPNSRMFEPGPETVDKPQSQSTSIRSSVQQPPAPRPNSPAEKVPVQSLTDTDMFYQKALDCHRSGRRDEALRFYQSVLAKNAEHQGALLNLAALYIEEGHFAQARPLLEQLEAATPRPKGVLLNLAITALGSDLPKVALAYLDRAEAAGDAPVWQIQFHRAVAFSRLDRPAEALALYQQVARERPSDYRVIFNLALTYDALADYPQALRYYEALLGVPEQTTPRDRQVIIQRMGLLRRYLNSTQPQPKRQ